MNTNDPYNLTEGEQATLQALADRAGCVATAINGGRAVRLTIGAFVVAYVSVGNARFPRTFLADGPHIAKGRPRGHEKLRRNSIDALAEAMLPHLRLETPAERASNATRQAVLDLQNLLRDDMRGSPWMERDQVCLLPSQYAAALVAVVDGERMDEPDASRLVATTIALKRKAEADAIYAGFQEMWHSYDRSLKLAETKSD